MIERGRMAVHSGSTLLAGPVHRRSFLLGLLGAPFLSRIVPAQDQSQTPPITLATAPYSRAFDFATLSTWITPNEHFFVRSHFGVPELDPDGWNFKITGAVERERTLSIT